MDPFVALIVIGGLQFCMSYIIGRDFLHLPPSLAALSAAGGTGVTAAAAFVL